MLLLAPLALFLAGPATAQCCGDCDGDGQVDISELIRAVNGALDPTCAPPADACPYTFDTLSLTQRCAFAGRFNATCGPRTRAIVAVDGDTIAAVFNTTPAVGFVATRTSATTADLVSWSVEPFATDDPVSGTMELLDGRTALTIVPDAPPFAYGGCDFVHYRGEFEQTIPLATLQNFIRTRRNFHRTR